MEYGLQMYSLRDITGEDLKGALEKVSKIGYKGRGAFTSVIQG